MNAQTTATLRVWEVTWVRFDGSVVFAALFFPFCRFLSFVLLSNPLFNFRCFPEGNIGRIRGKARFVIGRYIQFRFTVAFGCYRAISHCAREH